jgi:hypothetical protein
MQEFKVYLIFLIFLFTFFCKGQQHNNSNHIVDRPKTSKISNSTFPLKNLFGVWVQDRKAPHAEFSLNKEYYYIADYDGDGRMPYVLRRDTLIVYYNDTSIGTTTGIIKKVANDSLIISWDFDNYKDTITYIRFRK